MGVADDDETFFFVGNAEKAVEKMDGLLFVIRQLLAQRINAERGGGGHGNGIPGGGVKTLANGRDGRGDDSPRETLIVDVGDVVDAEASGTEGGIGVFAAGLDIEDVSGMRGGDTELAAVVQKLLVTVRFSLSE